MQQPIIDYSQLTDSKINIQSFLQDILQEQIIIPNSIDEADNQLHNLMSFINELQNTLEIKQQKLSKELETAQAVTQFNIETKQQEEQQIRVELQQFNNEFKQLQK